MNRPGLASLEGLMDGFASISLSEMDGIRLMNRIDTKYLTSFSRLEALLDEALDYGYMVFEQNGVRIQDYDSVYFDTPALTTYTEHRRGKLVRQKIRTRRYSSSGVCFLEIKNKNNHSRTKKKRVELALGVYPYYAQDTGAAGWLGQRCMYGADSLGASLGTAFKRITLVNRERTERLTIDMDVRFRNFRTGVEAGMGSAVIIELKQDGRTSSLMGGILLRHRILPCRISKYCVGITATTPGIRAGRFKEKVRLIDKINNAESSAIHACLN